MRASGVLVLLGAVGCGGDETGEPPVPLPGEGHCIVGEVALDDGRCIAAGTQPNGCPAGQFSVDGSCEPAGIPPEACGEGFSPDDARGCVPVLPASPCPDGQLAVPGDTECRELAPCGAAPWGDIPVDANTEYVDASYAVGDSDGSAVKPWTTITDAVAAASSGAIVAIAAGRYEEDVQLTGKPARLWGRCPELVEIVGSASAIAAIDIRTSAGGSEIRSLAVTGGALGIGASGSQDLIIDRVWVHDTFHAGIDLEGVFGPTGASVSTTVVERARESGMFVSDASLAIVDCAVRATVAPSQAVDSAGVIARSGISSLEPAAVSIVHALLEANAGMGVRLSGSSASLDGVAIIGSQPTAAQSGAGITATADDAARVSELSVSRSFIAENPVVGIFASGATLSMDATVVRDTLPRADDAREGRGVSVQYHPDTGAPSNAKITQSLIAKSHSVGFASIGADAELTGVLVQDVAPDQADDTGGGGIAVHAGKPDGARTRFTMLGSTVERAYTTGILLDGVDGVLEGVAVRDIEPQSIGGWAGVGISAQLQPSSGVRANATIRWSQVERTHHAGIFVGAADALIEGVLVRDTTSDGSQRSGRGISIQVDPDTATPASGVVRGCVVERSIAQGIAVLGSSCTVTGTLVRDTDPQPLDQFMGDGVAVISVLQPAMLTLTDSLVENSARAGVVAWGANIALGRSLVRCNPIALSSESFQEQRSHFEDTGGNRCGCADVVQECKATTSDLAAPEAITD